MKRVIIGEKCIGCGICLHNKKYIEETTDGIARAIPGMMVTDKDLPDLRGNIRYKNSSIRGSYQQYCARL